MTREQLDALEELLAAATTEAPDVLDAIRSSIAMARRALELEEALEFAASDKASLYKTSDGRYCCVLFEGGAGVEESFFGSTPLEAIQNARRAYAD